MTNVVVFIPKGTEYFKGDDEPYFTQKDYYTTLKIKEEDLPFERYIKKLAMPNLIKQIAKNEWCIQMYKLIEIDIVDIKISKKYKQK